MSTVANDIREIAAQATRLLEAIQAEDREPTEEETRQLDEWQAAITGLKARETARERTAALLAKFGTNGGPKPGEPAPRPALPTGQTTALVRSLGQQFVESEIYRDFRAGGGPRGGSWAMPVIDLQAAVITGPATIWPGTLAPIPFPVPPMMLSLLGGGTVDGNVVPYVRETTWTNNAAVVAPGAAKPESIKDFTLITAALLKIAHYVAVADEFLADVAGLRSFIDQQMLVGVLQKLENEVINGDGTSGHFLGILNTPGVGSIAHSTTAPAAPLATPILGAIAQLQALGYQPNGIVVNPTTFASVVSESSPNAGYYLGPDMVTQGMTMRLWGLPVIASAAMAAGTALVGDFARGAALYRKDTVAVQATNSHQDFFVKNVTAIRAEVRAALAVFWPQAFVKITNLTGPPMLFSTVTGEGTPAAPAAPAPAARR
jgi:hypothetical protein